MELKLNTENKPQVIADNVVVTLDYELSVDGQVVDSSDGGDPIIFLQGTGQIIAGLEKSIYGMKIGESKQIIVAPEDGYGEIDSEEIVEVPRDEFPEDFPLEPGVEITVNSENDDNDEDEDELLEATIISVTEDTVTLDFNHPFAGKTLSFKVNVMDIREATDEELEHGHVHSDDDFYFEDEDFDDEENENNHQ
jgi:FKBP-type peptidyl-prolyl cis-trans isomerase SlyD